MDVEYIVCASERGFFSRIFVGTLRPCIPSHGCEKFSSNQSARRWLNAVYQENEWMGYGIIYSSHRACVGSCFPKRSQQILEGTLNSSERAPVVAAVIDEGRHRVENRAAHWVDARRAVERIPAVEVAEKVRRKMTRKQSEKERRN